MGDSTELKDNVVIMVLIAIFLPPVVILVKYGTANIPSLVINIVLCCFGWIPGCVHALWHIFKDPS